LGGGDGQAGDEPGQSGGLIHALSRFAAILILLELWLADSSVRNKALRGTIRLSGERGATPQIHIPKCRLTFSRNLAI
jgi:hypothetical protein